MNEAGTGLRPLLAEGTTEERLAAHLVDHYGMERVTAEADVRTFLATLGDRRLLET